MATHHAALDGRGVYRQLHGAAHAHILEGILALHIGFQKLRAHLIQPQIDGAQFRPLDDAHPRGARNPIHILRRHGIDKIHLAREQRGHARRVIGNDVEFGACQIMHRLVPPIGIGGDNRATVRLTRNQDEGAGAHRIARGEVFHTRCQIRRARGVVLFRPGAAEHAPIGDFLQQDRIGHGGFEIYRVIINLAHFLHGSEHTLHIGTRCARTFNAEHHIIGGEGRTIREFHIAAQMKAPNIWLRLFPAFSKCGFHLAFMVAANERFIEIGPEGEQEGFLPGIGIHGIHIAIIGPAEVIGLGRQGGTGQQSGGKGQAAQHEAFSPIRTRRA